MLRDCHYFGLKYGMKISSKVPIQHGDSASLHMTLFLNQHMYTNTSFTNCVTSD